MKRHKLMLWLMLFLLLSGLTACSSQVAGVKISPETCTVNVGETQPFVIQGSLPKENLRLVWEASSGGIVSLSNGLTAQFTAPDTPGEVTITLTVGEGSEATKAYASCTVIDPNAPTETPTAVTTSVDVAPSPTNTPLPTASPSWTIAITEVMVNPCGGDDYKRFNQYVELYNYGNAPVDVGSLWIYAPNSDHRGQKLVFWLKRNPNALFDPSLVLNSTVIPAGKTAVILPPDYARGNRPYHFPAGTVILTVAQGSRLGDEHFAIRASEQVHDVVILYQGGSTKMSTDPISTYGTPRTGVEFLADVYDDGRDNLPRITDECESMERKSPTAADSVSNWRAVFNGTPGEYVP